MWKTLFAICAGGSIGAMLRWFLSVLFNDYFAPIPPGTLLANLIGAYIVGIAIAYFSTAASLSPEWRLFIITGFCGGLTTFSTFSVEIVSLLQQGRMAMACGAIAAHLGGSLLMTFAGIGTAVWIRG